MKIVFKYLSLTFVVLSAVGCAGVMDFPKSVWGSSTRALEQARVNAIIRTYNQPPERCYDEALKAAGELEYKIFINNKPRATIVLMGIKGAVNTTEVGIFFSEVADGQTKIFISSLSSNAKRIVADKIFPKLDASLGSSDNQSVTVIN